MPEKSSKNRTNKKNSINGRKKNHRSTQKKRAKILVQSSGVFQSISFLNGKKKEKGFEWNSDYNGEKARVNIKIRDNGEKKTFHKEFDPNEMEKLLSMPSVNQSLHQRLIQDFPLSR